MEEPTTPKERAVFIASRIESAMRDFARMHPPASTRGERVPASYAALSGRAWAIVPAHDEPVRACDWSLDYGRQREAGAALVEGMALYVEGMASLAEVKALYQAFAAAHLVWWVGGRMFYAEEAARLAVVEAVNQRLRVPAAETDTEAVARPVGRVAEPPRRPRLAYSRGRDS